MIKKRVQYVIFGSDKNIRICADKFANARGNASVTDTIFAYEYGTNVPCWKYLWNGSEWVLTNA